MRRSGTRICLVPLRNAPSRIPAWTRCRRPDLPRRPSPVLPCSWAEVDDPVGCAHHLLVVLDDEHGVAHVAKPLERVDESIVVALVEPDRRLVEDVEDTDESCEPICVASRRRCASPPESVLAARSNLEVADTDVLQEHEPLAHLLQDAPTDEPPRFSSARASSTNRSARATDIRVNPWIERSPIVTASTSGLSRAPLHSGHGRKLMYSSMRSRAGRVGLAVPTLEVGHEALERHRVLPLPSHPVAVGHEDLSPPVPCRKRSCCSVVAPRHVERDLVPVRDRLDHRVVEALAADRPRDERAPRSRATRPGRAGRGRSRACAPSPVHRGHAPCGELNEKIRGSAPGSDTPCSGHAKFSENVRLLPSITSTTTSPSASEVAVSIDCVSRWRRSGFITRRSTTTSIVCLSFLSRTISSSRSRCSPSIFTRVNLSRRASSRTSLYCPAVAGDRGVDRELVPRRAAVPAPRSGRATGRRSDARRSGSAVGRYAHTAGAGSRRSP